MHDRRKGVSDTFVRYNGVKAKNCNQTDFLNVGDRIRDTREIRGLTQTELGRAMGTDYRHIHFWETNSLNPSVKNLQKLSELLDVDYDWLANGTMTKLPMFEYEIFNFEDHPEIFDEHDLSTRAQFLDDEQDMLSLLKCRTLAQLYPVMQALLLHDACVKDNVPFDPKSEEYLCRQYWFPDGELAASTDAKHIDQIIEILNEYKEVLKKK